MENENREEHAAHDKQVITPWEVHGERNDGGQGEVNYKKVIEQFGCSPITSELLSRLKESVQPPHRFFRRNIVFAHRDFDVILEKIKKRLPIFLYTGRGPSSKSMHLGHAIPFILCKHLQDVFDVPLIIQITDDEKYIWKDITLEESVAFGRENSKDIIAFGFDPKKTFIFSNVEYAHHFVGTTLKIEKIVSLSEYTKIFGFGGHAKIGQIVFPSKQLAPCYPAAFPLFLKGEASCLIPCAIDQDPYFRLARDISNQMNSAKPATLYSTFLPSLQGSGTKMSASNPKSSIYLDDKPKDIERKINRYAFSGGKDTIEEHREKGGDPEIDVAYQYLRFFLEDDAKLEQYAQEYRSGVLLSGQLKRLCIEAVQSFVEEFQKRRAQVSDDVLREFFNPNKAAR
jgi:tryptophanyl-tRNA synthetase